MHSTWIVLKKVDEGIKYLGLLTLPFTLWMAIVQAGIGSKYYPKSLDRVGVKL